MGFSCATCRDPKFPDLERFIASTAGPCWRSESDVARIQAAAVEVGLRAGYCDRHVAWLGELVGWTVREDAARRDVLTRAAAPREGR